MKRVNLPASAEEYLHFADRCLECDDLDGGLIYTLEACKKEQSDRDRSDCYVALAQLFFKADNVDFAVRALMKALFYNEYNHKAEIVLFIVYVQTEQFGKATYYLKRFRSAAQSGMLFDTVEEMGLDSDILHAYFEELLSEKDGAQGKSALKGKDGKQSRRALKLIDVKKNREESEVKAFAKLSEALEGKTRQEAIDAVDAFAARYASNRTLQTGCAVLACKILRQNGDLAAAEQRIARAKAIMPDNLAVVQEECLLRYACGDVEVSEDLLDDVLDSEEPLDDLLEEAQYNGYHRLTLDYCEFCLDDDPYDYYLYDLYARTLLKTGDYDKARKIWADCARIFGEFCDASAKLRLMREYRKSGNPAPLDEEGFLQTAFAYYSGLLDAARREGVSRYMREEAFWDALRFPLYHTVELEKLRGALLERTAREGGAEGLRRLKETLVDYTVGAENGLTTRIVYALLCANYSDTVAIAENGVFRKALLRTPQEAYDAGEGFLKAYRMAYATEAIGLTDPNDLRPIYWKSKEIGSALVKDEVPLEDAYAAAAALIATNPDEFSKIGSAMLAQYVGEKPFRAYLKRFNGIVADRDKRRADATEPRRSQS